MHVKFQVLGSGQSSFTSPKNGRTYNRLRLMGMIEDAYDQTTAPCIADLGFDCPSPGQVKSGDWYLLDCSEITTKNAMLSCTFVSLAPFSTPSKRS